MTRRALICWIWVGSLLLAAVLARGAAVRPDPQLRVYVLTFGPGDDPWEKWGHNAIRIVDPSAPLPALVDRTYNWGVFTFDNSFYWKFLQGRLIYSIASDPSDELQAYYLQVLHRSVYQQELNLPESDKRQLRDELRRLDTDANRHYLYNYYTVNCTTKVRDAVDKAVGGKLAQATKGKPTGTTYRFHTDRADADTIWLYIALQGVLGHPVDREIDQWQEMFLPMKLHDRLSELKVELNGRSVPLVKEEWVNLANRPPEPQRPPVRAPWLLLVGLLLGAMLALLARTVHRSAPARWTFITLSTLWLLLMGIGGGLIWWGWFFTDHEVAARNENVMHVSVLALPLLVLLPRLVRAKRSHTAVTQWLVWIMAGVSVLGLLLKALPAFYQVNWSIIALCLPVNLALAYAAWVIVPPQTQQHQPTSTTGNTGKVSH